MEIELVLLTILLIVLMAFNFTIVREDISRIEKKIDQILTGNK